MNAGSARSQRLSSRQIRPITSIMSTRPQGSIDHLAMAIRRRNVQGRDGILVKRVDVRALREKERHRVRVTLL